MLLVLQHLGKTMDKHKLCRLFDDSKVNLLHTLPKCDRSKDRLTEILEERELSFLFPLLKIQQDMSKQLQTSSDAQDFFSWIKQNVDSTYHSSQGFISALMTVVFKFVYSEAAQSNGASQTNEKIVKEKESEFLLKYKPIFNEFLHDHVDLQVIAIYALQASWFAMGSPKVVLLRWFMNLYELDIIEEDAYLKWKEDIRDEFPGKGQALFQVNQWLQLLQEANESEGDSDEE
jgi:translation initiation factor 4G